MCKQVLSVCSGAEQGLSMVQCTSLEQRQSAARLCGQAMPSCCPGRTAGARAHRAERKLGSSLWVSSTPARGLALL